MLDYLGHVSLEVCGRKEVLEFRQVLIRNLTLPLELATAFFDHCAETRVLVHELLEGLGESLGTNFTDVHGKDNEVEVALDVVHDLGLQVSLPVVGGDIKGHLGLNDALSDVLNTSAAGRSSGKIDQFVDLSLSNLCLWEGSKKLLDDLKLSHLHGISVLLNFNVNAGKTQLLLLESIKNVIGNNSTHSVELSGELEFLDKCGTDNSCGGTADTSLTIEDDRARGGCVLEHGDNLVKVCLLGCLLLVHGNADWLKLGNLVLDGSIDLIESGHTSKLLSELLIGGSLLRVLSKLDE